MLIGATVGYLKMIESQQQIRLHKLVMSAHGTLLSGYRDPISIGYEQIRRLERS